MRVLVTGGLGMIGRVVVQQLLAAGISPVVVDQVAPAGAEIGVTSVQCDLTDLQATLEVVRDVDVVFHLAAIPNPTGPLERVLGVNVMSNYNVLEAARQNGIPRVIYSCSDSASGFGIHLVNLKPLYLPIDESHPMWPHETYSLSKYFGEEMLANYARAFGIEGIALRYTWVWTERDRPSVRRIAAARQAGLVDPNGWFGAFIGVEDVAQAFLLASQYRFPQDQHPPFEAFYLSSADTFMSEPTLDALARRFDPLPEIRDPQYFAANPHAVPFDTRKAQRMLGWKPSRFWRDYVDW